MRKKYIIGIDPGRQTGIAVKNLEKDRIIFVNTCEMWEAWDEVAILNFYHVLQIAVVIEDARLGGGHWNRSQGAGSVKRDCSAWEEFLRGNGIPFVSLSPRATAKGKKMKVDRFREITGYSGEGRITEHARDAAMMILGYNAALIEAQLKAAEIRKK